MMQPNSNWSVCQSICSVYFLSSCPVQLINNLYPQSAYGYRVFSKFEPISRSGPDWMKSLYSYNFLSPSTYRVIFHPYKSPFWQSLEKHLKEVPSIYFEFYKVANPIELTSSQHLQVSLECLWFNFVYTINYNNLNTFFYTNVSEKGACHRCL